MKKYLIIGLVVLLYITSNAQEVSIKAANITTAGLSSATQGTVNISKWQIGEVYQLTITDGLMNPNKEESILNVYPNPFSSELHIQLKHNRKEVCKIVVLDVSGRVCKTIKDETFLPNQAVELDLNELRSGMYLLSVKPKDLEKQWMVKIQKQ
ncbi:T9SS type A sorting domain-containing protein [Maribellus sp. CM-23]|uniref:T9SS type A sorting domain-containing protein n=1 Tax=Maribellus sp. CM-23 TaxID=2781026 RepID=UPI001F181ADA|nr:T9SS type A sorting domain-containing protein [Maribellus sp. CM-23]MCE4566224.1 T9SS type A sorting domain-containing protein [Maribellus sp. CM-23]